MALQIMSGTLHGIGKEKEILYDDSDPKIYITDALKPICDEFFQERTFLECDEEITVNIVPFNGLRPLSFRIEKEALRVVSSMISAETNARDANTRFDGEVVNEWRLNNWQSKSLATASVHQLMHLISMRSYVISELTRRPFSSNRRNMFIRINCAINSRRINVIPLLRSIKHDKKSNQYIQAIYKYLKQETEAYLDKINEPEIKSALKDFTLLQSLIISTLLKPNPRRCVLTII